MFPALCPSFRLPRRFASAAALLFLYSLTAHAQTRPPAGGLVAGHVVFAESDKPARFATVYLKPVQPADPGDDFFTVLMDSAIVNMQSKQGGQPASSADDARDLSSARAAANGFLAGVSDSMLSATVAANGDYTFTGVPPGRYYLHVKAPGYIDTLAAFSPDELNSHDPEVRKKIAAAVDIVAIAGQEEVHANLRLERGAVVSGRVFYDDGSPAVGWTVRAIPKRIAGAELPTSVLGIDLGQLPAGEKLDRTLTDDTGHFRIAGLPTGSFFVEASLTTAALDRKPFGPVSSASGSFLSMLGGLSELSGLRLVAYSGNVPRLHDAEAIAVHAGEERPGSDLVVALSSSHSVAGSVQAKTDGHSVNSGTVELIVHDNAGQDDRSLCLHATIQPDGTFRFDYVPAPATYTLRALHAADTTVSTGMKLLGSLIAEHKMNRSYGPASTVVELRDVDITGVKLSVDLPPTQSSQNRPPTP